MHACICMMLDLLQIKVFFICHHVIEMAVRKGHNEKPEMAQRILLGLKAFSKTSFETRE